MPVKYMPFKKKKKKPICLGCTCDAVWVYGYNPTHNGGREPKLVKKILYFLYIGFMIVKRLFSYLFIYFFGC